ncbi:janus kinase and microtubule-interacting protein 3 isoform X1 [Temnothorax curvispinosus]|uniref:Janus kinase and microtubule-interacting protein 3 isoform X1 n=1 Tax=Temnothorax curvispinosus TaxID=300111 RepID=A0A6J1R0J7_9HYME|nr:janus kinase and microtubule-interacting protein 3 isoform X1 [Temnothorax curvispinosus]XP_024888142.1 janus kinase and microtubule-interacting protein 3 isoform X1 [Temnothorax curvispinosus]
MASSSEGDTVKPTNTNKSTTTGINILASTEGARKRRRLESLTTNSEIPEKTQRRDESCNSYAEATNERRAEHTEDKKDSSLPRLRKKEQAVPINPQDVRMSRSCEAGVGRSDATRLRKTIQWLEEGARKLREDLANVRTELHEERRAAKIAKREFETALRETRFAEAAKYQPIIADLKTRIVQSVSPSPSPSPPFKSDPVKDESHKHELSTLRKRLIEAGGTIRKLEQLVKSQANIARNTNGTSSYGDARRLEAEIRNLRAENEKLEEKLRIALNAEKTRIAEIRAQRESHEAELSALRKSLRSEAIKMMDELRGKSREIEKLSKLLKRRKLAPAEQERTMRKLRENEGNRPIQAASRTEKKILKDDGHIVRSYVRAIESDRAINEIEVERLRELALEQQEVIEILRQAVKERERKLEQLSNKKRKEEFYKQWLELEPVAEVDDEEDHEDDDSALSSAPSSMSPQPGGYGQWQGNGVTREAYEAVLVEIEELQSKLLKEQRELSHARAHICDLEKALLQEKCTDRDKELNELNDKLRAAEEREATLLVELSEIREQNELLEFRLLEMEEIPVRKDSPNAVDSGIVSPEPAHTNKDHSINKQRSRAVATVIPYTNNATINSVISTSPVLPRKPPLTLQESGIFEEEEEEEGEKEYEDEDERDVEFASRGTQTEAPSGELLQEVQRLQELRARIQERAAKITTPVFQPIDSSKICLDVSTMDPIVQLTSYQERVRDLEERLEMYEEGEKSREQEKRLSKQREEELLDENYRLTERVYWLENELRTVAKGTFDEHDGEDRGETTANEQQMNDVSQTKHQVPEDMQKNSEDVQDQCEDANCTRAVQTIETYGDYVAINCPRCQDKDNSDQQIIQDAQRNITLVSLEEKEKEDELKLCKSEKPAVIDLTKNDSEKKVSRRRIRSNEREVRPAKTARMTNRFVRDISFGRRNHPLVLYQEICV